MDSSSAAVDIEFLRKVYGGKVEALKGLKLQVPTGSTYGLLGANGAGKSTMIKSLLGILKPTKVVGTMLGRPIGNKEVRKKVGYLPENPDFANYLTGAQVIEYSAGLAGMSGAGVKRKRDELLELVGMREWGDQRMKRYSKGMRQRVGLAQALVTDPDLVFLDEPTDGVDPKGRREIRVIIEEMNRRGATVFLNSHLLAEVEMMCDRVCILAQGELVIEGNLDELVQQEPGWRVNVNADVSDEDFERLQKLGKLRRGEGNLSARELVVAGKDAQVVQPVIDALRQQQVQIVGVEQVRISLEDLYLRHVGSQGPGAQRKSGKGRQAGPPPLNGMGGGGGNLGGAANEPPPLN